MKIGEIRQFTDEELANERERLRRHVFDLRAQAVTEKLEDPTLIKKARKDIARILTEIRQREQAASVASAQDSEAK